MIYNQVAVKSLLYLAHFSFFIIRYLGNQNKTESYTSVFELIKRCCC